jgi:formylglycine-generating enzyme required for sulfatase activity
LSEVTGKQWRLPTNGEWEAAVGKTKYPWGEYFPPKKEDGNYAILADGKGDSAKVGADGNKGTAPVGSFKANALGFHDLGGNVAEWMLDGFVEGDGRQWPRGGDWLSSSESKCSVSARPLVDGRGGLSLGFRMVLGSNR